MLCRFVSEPQVDACRKILLGNDRITQLHGYGRGGFEKGHDSDVICRWCDWDVRIFNHIVVDHLHTPFGDFYPTSHLRMVEKQNLFFLHRGFFAGVIPLGIVFIQLKECPPVIALGHDGTVFAQIVPSLQHDVFGFSLNGLSPDVSHLEKAQAFVNCFLTASRYFVTRLGRGYDC